jgi:hypothetical protein
MLYPTLRGMSALSMACLPRTASAIWVRLLGQAQGAKGISDDDGPSQRCCE